MFGVELVDGVVHCAPVGEVDARLSGRIVLWAHAVTLSKASWKAGRQC